MRIAHIITRMIIGGAQENTLLCCHDLMRDYGDEVLLIHGPSLGPEGDLLTEERAAGVPRVLVPSLLRSIHPACDLLAYRALKGHLREYRPQVVHTHSAKAGILGRQAAHRLGVPAVIHTVHGAPFHPYQNSAARNLFRWCETRAAKRCHRLVSVAESMTEQLVAAGVAPRDKFTTIYSGMDVEPFLHADRQRQELRRHLGYGPEHVVVGKIARLFHLKGHRYLVQAAKQVVAARPEVRFLLVGDGVLRGELQSSIRQAGLKEVFHFTGLVEPEQVAPLIGAMDVVVHCSLREGLARTLPQALIAGKPVVSYDVDGAREVVIPGETGFLLPSQSVDPLAAAMMELARSPALRHSYGAAGQARFTAQFRHQEMTRRLRALYRDVLGLTGHRDSSP